MPAHGVLLRRRTMTRRWLFLLMGVLSFIGADRAAGEYTSGDCVTCHTDGGSAGGSASKLQISIEEFRSSIHGSEVGCHVQIKDDEHEKAPGAAGVVCGECHLQENRHGGTAPDRPACHSCHGTHQMFFPSLGFKSAKIG